MFGRQQRDYARRPRLYRFGLTGTALWLLFAVAGDAHAETVETAENPVDGWLNAVVLLVSGPAYCSGVLIDDAGTVATAYHCVANGLQPQVRTRDNQRFTGQTTATAPKDDLALVAVPGLAGRPHLDVRGSKPVVGETVWALGHPFAPAAETSKLFEGLLQWSASRGVVSAVGQRLIQIDAAINPGNSGGPTVDSEGLVVGIASRKLRADNIGFVSPASALLRLRDTPEGPALFGGVWGAHLTGLQSVAPGQSATLGMLLTADLRDRVVFRAGAHQPVGHRWQAESYGSALWLASEGTISARLRVGRGRNTAAIELGGGGGSTSGAVYDADRDEVLPVGIKWAPMGVARLAYGGAAIRLLRYEGQDGAVHFFALDLDMPGMIGMF